jgi:uncharacterized alkaline shock family protein YloU
VEGHAVISHEVLASYAADAARQVDGIHELVGGPRRHRGVRVAEDDGTMSVELQVAVEWGSLAPDVAVDVQRRVGEYLRRTARLPSVTVHVVVAGVAATKD